MYDRDQAALRLANTVVEYDGRPYLVANVSGNNVNPTLDLMDLPKQRDVIKILADDPKLNYRRFQLGYVNYNRNALYLSRMPARQQKQGLCNTNVNVSGDGRWNFNIIMGSDAINDVFQNRYPTFNEAVDSIKPGESMAFSRRFAVYLDEDLGFYELRYKGERIAWGDPAVFNLPSNYTYLTEVIQQEGIRVR